MIEPRDLTQQKQVYSRNGMGRWAVLGYCPHPSVTMVNLETGERLNFGLAGSMNSEFEPLHGEVCGPDERAVRVADILLQQNAGGCLPCPFCGSTDCEADTVEGSAKYDEDGDFVHHFYEVWCSACNATGPRKDTLDESVAAWNGRRASAVTTSP